MKAITILLIEDDYLNRRLTRKILAEQGFRILEAANYNEAIPILEKEFVDLLILDINLGENNLDGITIGQILKEKFAIPFIYLTAYETQDIINKAITTKPISYLTKPLKPADLLASIMMTLNKSEEIKQKDVHIIVKEDEYYLKIPIDQIDFFESEGNYLLVHSNFKVFKYRSTLLQVLGFLPGEIFLQTHRAFVVNIEKIEMFNTKHLIIKNKTIPISKNFLNKLIGIFKTPND
jgi:DNA-binding LytR/AlgR family response regulator